MRYCSHLAELCTSVHFILTHFFWPIMYSWLAHTTTAAAIGKTDDALPTQISLIRNINTCVQVVNNNALPIQLS